MAKDPATLSEKTLDKHTFHFWYSSSAFHTRVAIDTETDKTHRMQMKLPKA